MVLTPGTKLGPYELVALIGAGGMGEVYRARDPRLGRDVAVKVLPASFAADPDRLRRFEQEARAVAALNHPNILGVHDLGQQDGTPYMACELLEGETLRVILARGPLSHRKCIDYAVQVAHGLAAAHGKNIAHRDLKPDNIFITREGRVKILDFGLAKTIEKNLDSKDTHIATMTSDVPLTGIGTVVGTAGYMSPEQVRGATVDCRTDIFSFGAVLYEMLSGVRAFQRDTTAETMTAILHDDPPESPSGGRPFPPALDRIVHHCLEKAPEQRFQSARDMAFDLESVTTLTASGGLSAARAKERKTRTSLFSAAAALVLLAGLAGWLLSSARHPATGAQFHQVTFRRGTPGTARFTPDGQNVVYTAAWEAAEPELYNVPADGVGGHPMGIKDARLLAISSKGELAVALTPQLISTLLAPGNLARTTGSSAPKPEIENIQAADFTPDGSALAIVRYVPADFKCQLEYPIGKVLYRERLIDDVRFSANGKYLAFISHTNPSDDRGTVMIIRTTGEKVAASPLYESSQGLAWSVGGDEVWTSSPLESGEVHALSISGKTREPLAMPGRLHLRDISSKGQLLVGQGIARRGIVVSSNHGESLRDLSWLDFSFLRDISDDGKMILFEEEGSSTANYTVYVRDADGSPAVPIGEGYASALSRDKKWALAIKLTEPNHEIWLLPVGPGEPRRVNPPNLVPANVLPRFLSDGSRIVYSATEVGQKFPRIWLQNLNDGSPKPISPEGVLARNVSPDDKWVLVFVRDTTGKGQPGVLSIEGGNPVEITGLKPAENPLGWTSDGQLYVASADTTGAGVKVAKLNPHTGARTPWRVLATAPIGGVIPDPPIITPDGNSYGFDYRVRLSDLYTVTGVR